MCTGRTCVRGSEGSCGWCGGKFCAGQTARRATGVYKHTYAHTHTHTRTNAQLQRMCTQTGCARAKCDVWALLVGFGAHGVGTKAMCTEMHALCALLAPCTSCLDRPSRAGDSAVSGSKVRTGQAASVCVCMCVCLCVCVGSPAHPRAGLPQGLHRQAYVAGGRSGLRGACGAADTRTGAAHCRVADRTNHVSEIATGQRTQDGTGTGLLCDTYTRTYTHRCLYAWTLHTHGPHLRSCSLYIAEAAMCACVCVCVCLCVCVCVCV